MEYRPSWVASTAAIIIDNECHRYRIVYSAYPTRSSMGVILCTSLSRAVIVARS